MWYMILTAMIGMVPPASDVVVSADNSQVVRPAAFTLAQSPFALGGQYLVATAGDPATPAAVRVAAPEGEWYVYLSWVRHPHGAKDVVVRVGDLTIKVDQSRLANGHVPDAFPRDDMAQFEGLCSSGLYRLTSQPVRFTKDDVIEIVRSDTVPGTVTTRGERGLLAVRLLGRPGQRQPLGRHADDQPQGLRPDVVGRHRVRPRIPHAGPARRGHRVVAAGRWAMPRVGQREPWSLAGRVDSVGGAVLRWKNRDGCAGGQERGIRPQPLAGYRRRAQPAGSEAPLESRRRRMRVRGSAPAHARCKTPTCASLGRSAGTTSPSSGKPRRPSAPGWNR